MRNEAKEFVTHCLLQNQQQKQALLLQQTKRQLREVKNSQHNLQYNFNNSNNYNNSNKATGMVNIFLQKFLEGQLQ